MEDCSQHWSSEHIMITSIIFVESFDFYVIYIVNNIVFSGRMSCIRNFG